MMKRLCLVLAVVAVSCGRPGPPQAFGPQQSARRIVRTAELWLETDSPDEARRKVATLAAAKGGFVVSVGVGRTGSEGASLDVVLRVPVAAFEATLETLRALGTRVVSEKEEGSDVTEEYVDVEARQRASRAVEAQYLEILKQARTVKDTLEVQEKLGSVRGDIERAEGRRRYLESMTELAAITVHFSKSEGASALDFTRTLRDARHDAWEVSVGTVTALVRVLGVLLPLGLLFGLPSYLTFLMARLLRRRERARTRPP